MVSPIVGIPAQSTYKTHVQRSTERNLDLLNFIQLFKSVYTQCLTVELYFIRCETPETLNFVPLTSTVNQEVEKLTKIGKNLSELLFHLGAWCSG